MGLAFSQYLYGCHATYEILAGGLLYVTGSAGAFDPLQAEHTTASDKMWKRVQGGAFMTLGYLGVIALSTKCPGTKRAVNKSCGLYHAITFATLPLAMKEGYKVEKELIIFNPHLWMAVGFGSLLLGYTE